MPYSGMTPKQKRIIERDVESLFSPGAFLPNPTVEDFKRMFEYWENLPTQCHRWSGTS
jgi:hypothetical protein